MTVVVPPERHYRVKEEPKEIFDLANKTYERIPG